MSFIITSLLLISKQKNLKIGKLMNKLLYTYSHCNSDKLLQKLQPKLLLNISNSYTIK